MTSNQINYWKYIESERAAKAQEAINSLKLQEEVRHNLATEKQAYIEYGETARANLAKEAENVRSHKVQEAETERSNRAREAETERHQRAVDSINMLSLIESERAHKASEAIGRGNISLGYSQVGLGYSQLGETMRHNEVTEAELNRHQETVEGETQRHNEATEGETYRSNVTKEKETQRHNEQTEYQQYVHNQTEILNTVVKGIGTVVPLLI